MKSGREYSLRRHVWRVVALVALSPLLLTSLGVPLDHWMRYRLSDRSVAAAQACLAQIEMGGSCAPVAEEFDVWLRVLADGEVVENRDEGTRAAVGWVEQLMDPESRFWLQENDPFEGDTGRPDSCGTEGLNRLLTCTAQREGIVRGAQVRVLSVAADVRSVRALSADGVTKLALEVLLVALLVGWWLGRRIVDPIETLRSQVLARVRSRSAEPVDADDPTEVGEVAAAFNALIADLEHRRRANQDFAADLAHELKNPVATVLSLAENLEDGSSADSQNQQYAAILRRSGEQLNELVQDFLDLARAEAGLEHAERRRVQFDELVEALGARFRADPRFEDRALDVFTSAGDILGSAHHLEMAVGNVLENALQIVGEGGHVAVRLDSDAAQLQLQIADDGPGIEPEALPHVFDRFFSRRKGGTGLGLPLASAIARAHRGELTVESAVGSGTTFTFLLPSYESHTETTGE